MCIRGRNESVSSSEKRSRVIGKSNKTCCEREEEIFFEQTKISKNNTGNYDCQSDPNSGINVLAGCIFFKFGRVIHGVNLSVYSKKKVPIS